MPSAIPVNPPIWRVALPGRVFALIAVALAMAVLAALAFANAMVAATYPGVIVSAAQRQAAWLHRSVLALAEGTPSLNLSRLKEGFTWVQHTNEVLREISAVERTLL